MRNRASNFLTVAMWSVWALVCVVGVGWCWLRTFLATMTLFGDQIRPDQTRQARYFLDVAAFVSVAGAGTVALLAVSLLIVNHGRRPKQPVIALVLALVSPCLPVYLALNGTLIGE